VLTHFWPGNDRNRPRAAAAAVFSGEVLIAYKGAVSICADDLSLAWTPGWC